MTNSQDIQLISLSSSDRLLLYRSFQPLSHSSATLPVLIHYLQGILDPFPGIPCCILPTCCDKRSTKPFLTKVHRRYGHLELLPRFASREMTTPS